MPTIIPTFRYDDARAAITLLCEAFGFEEHAVHEDGGVIAHAELKLGDAYIMLGQTRDENRERVPAGPSSVYVVVEDVDALHARAVAAGAEIMEGLTERDYGSREFAARDPAGNVWWFGTYAPQD
ncbi:VOC family protein [Baekduia sp. Peel2402]|uniref:VOC family protein n=1 Tax=Baekduia sp. Peel2402 TaxID=3458296 RepID=UPI00403E80A0